MPVTISLGLTGVLLLLRPWIRGNQLWRGVAGLLSGARSAVAYGAGVLALQLAPATPRAAPPQVTSD